MQIEENGVLSDDVDLKYNVMEDLPTVVWPKKSLHQQPIYYIRI